MGAITGCRPNLKPPAHVFDGGAMKCLCGALDAFNRRVVQPPPRYTVAEITALAREYTNHARQHWAEEDVVDTELQLSLFVSWLARREQGKESRDGD